MPDFKTVRRVAYTPAQMYALVADVEKYPQFLPMCEGLTIVSRTQAKALTPETLVADMDVGFGLIKERFRSRVTLDASKPSVRADNLAGPFSQLANDWQFVATAGGCEVIFAISYTLKSAMLQLLVGNLFDSAFRRYAEAFEQRARSVYGPPKG